MTGIVRRIARFIRGDSQRTAFKASVMNEFVDAMNSLLSMRGDKGIKVTFSDSGPVIELTEALQRGLALTGDGVGGKGVEDGQGEGPMRWRGEWVATKTYAINDIVIYRSSSAISGPDKAGTYIAAASNINSEPLEAAAASQADWKTFAKGSWDRLYLYNSSGSRKITLDSTEGIQLIKVEDTSNGYYCSITPDLISVTAGGNTVAITSTGSGEPRIQLNGTSGSLIDLDVVEWSAVGAAASMQLIEYKDHSSANKTFYALGSNPV